MSSEETYLRRGEGHIPLGQFLGHPLQAAISVLSNQTARVSDSVRAFSFGDSLDDF